MSLPLAVLRPEPGNAATAQAIEAIGRRAIRLPLFRIVQLPWGAPTAGAHDALILTSANAVRQAGAALSSYAALPVHAVGAATAAAARAAGLRVVATGDADGQALLDAAAQAGVRRALLLTARDRAVGRHPVLSAVRAVYASEAMADVDPAMLAGSVALVHSRRAALRLAELVADRRAIAAAAIAPAVAAALGDGWRAIAIAGRPDDGGVVAAAAALAERLAHD
ncbi:uroporphyrinogen-III synthase [Sphingomonas sp. 2R-10]|uniref:uroporphyrinogen-III synthase n=1 Tax=Sphingomonas sp. 2R-10 TaxID=3045148 RepID=UPI000F7A51D7|nr:uroporphyrinogen-III synthase [Sphingomonas sp. 2R-10]MDJ0278356.1 uroporphyrinogen-III synthase [Sphingomonas sp. 2R-10]